MVRQRLENRVRLVAGMLINCRAPGMADEHGLGGRLDGFGGGAIAAMAQIYGHSNVVHAANRRMSGFAQAGIPRFQTTVAKDAAIVVGELHDADPQPAEHENTGGILFQKSTVLKAGENADLLFTFGAGDVGMSPHHHEGLWNCLLYTSD